MNAKEDTVVLIPAAGRVPDGVLSLSNISCPAMIPVAGRPVIHWTLGYLTSLGFKRFLIAVSDRGLFIEDFVDCTIPEDCQVDFLVPSKGGGVGDTIHDLAKAVPQTSATSALVVLGDTHFRLEDPAPLHGDAPSVLVSPVEESYRWCIAECAESDSVGDRGASNEPRTLARLRDKIPDLAGPLEALIGVYYFPELSRLQEATSQAVLHSQAKGARTELAPILESIQEATPVRVYRANEWLDCGNADRQASSHRSLLQERAFNQLTIDPVLGTIEKQSENEADLRDEVEYLRAVPAPLAVLFPRVLSSEPEAQPPRVTLEYYGYPTLSEVFLFDHLDPGVWDRIFEHLFRVVTEGFMTKTGRLADDALRSMYIVKTRARVDRLRDQPIFEGLLRDDADLTVNGKHCPRWSDLWPAIETAVADLESSLQPSFVHGDFHLGNILYDVRSGICKLIDPRGRFGDRGVYGDPRYDVAKLYHSIYGLYDLIVADLFSVRYERATEGVHELSLHMRARTQHATLRERFEERFFGHFDRQEILLLTGLLFVSMPPLHYDSPSRQLAMYARGMTLLAERFPELIDTPKAP